MLVQLEDKATSWRKMTWETWLKHGDQYLKASTPRNKKSRFGTDIRYNLISMSFEAYVMAILDYHNDLPDNHTFTDLVVALEKVIPIDEKLKMSIIKHENIQSICAIEKYHRRDPTESELTELKCAIAEIATMAHEICGT